MLDKPHGVYFNAVNPERFKVRDLIHTFGDNVRRKLESFAFKGKVGGVTRINRKGKSNFRKGHSGFSFVIKPSPSYSFHFFISFILFLIF
jgi:hypothetical protein